MTLIIKKQTGTAGYISYYVEYEGRRYFFIYGYKRKAKFQCVETGKILNGYIYPLYSFIEQGKKFFINQRGENE